MMRNAWSALRKSVIVITLKDFTQQIYFERTYKRQQLSLTMSMSQNVSKVSERSVQLRDDKNTYHQHSPVEKVSPTQKHGYWMSPAMLSSGSIIAVATHRPGRIIFCGTIW